MVETSEGSHGVRQADCCTAGYESRRGARGDFVGPFCLAEHAVGTTSEFSSRLAGSRRMSDEGCSR